MQKLNVEASYSPGEDLVKLEIQCSPNLIGTALEIGRLQVESLGAAQSHPYQKPRALPGGRG